LRGKVWLDGRQRSEHDEAATYLSRKARRALQLVVVTRVLASQTSSFSSDSGPATYAGEQNPDGFEERVKAAAGSRGRDTR
jgi:hypothetical protein